MDESVPDRMWRWVQPPHVELITQCSNKSLCIDMAGYKKHLLRLRPGELFGHCEKGSTTPASRDASHWWFIL